MTTLIMSDIRPQQIWDGIKTLTNRPVRDGDIFQPEGGNLPAKILTGKHITKWCVGGVTGIKPKLVSPVCLVDKFGEVVRDLPAEHRRVFHRRAVEPVCLSCVRDALLLLSDDYCLLQVRILALARVDVRAISDADAVAAGFTGAFAYLRWWTGTYDTAAVHLASWTVGGNVLNVLLESRPAEKYDAWQLRFEAVK